MIDPNTAKTVAELGVPSALLIAFLIFGIIFIPKVLAWYSEEQSRRDKAICDMQDRMVTVVENNTQVITRLCDSQSDTVTNLAQHDARAQRIEGAINGLAGALTQIGRVSDRKAFLPR